MTRMLCLDGAVVRIDADRVEVDLAARGLRPADHAEAAVACTCCGGAAWLPVMSYENGTTVYLHAPAGDGQTPGYRVAGPRAHRWVLRVTEEAGVRVAFLAWETAERVEKPREPARVVVTPWRAAS